MGLLQRWSGDRAVGAGPLPSCYYPWVPACAGMAYTGAPIYKVRISVVSRASSVSPGVPLIRPVTLALFRCRWVFGGEEASPRCAIFGFLSSRVIPAQLPSFPRTREPRAKQTPHSSQSPTKTTSNYGRNPSPPKRPSTAGEGQGEGDRGGQTGGARQTTNNPPQPNPHIQQTPILPILQKSLPS